MKQTRFFSLLLCLLLLTSGCSSAASSPELPEEAPAETTAAILPEANPDAVVAWTADTALTNGALQVWYWAEAAQYCRDHPDAAPDLRTPLHSQPCTLETYATWHDYFLDRALNSWHTAQALICQGRDEGVPLEEAYKPHEHEKYVNDKPAAKVLYGFYDSYQPNSMHQAWLDAIPQTLSDLAREQGYADTAAMAEAVFGAEERDLLAFVQDYNLAYMYFTTLSYDLEPTSEDIALFRSQSDAYADTTPLVSVRHILLTPGEDAEEKAMELLETWLDSWPAPTEAGFAQMAFDHSQDPGSVSQGGLYREVRQGQLCEALDRWCFDDRRQEGDTSILTGEDGYHIVYFCGRTEAGFVQARQALIPSLESGILAQAREKYPMETAPDFVTVMPAGGSIACTDLLYPDIAHERFPEVPLYLQQDYAGTMYGNYKITTNGCGITSLAMLASYLADDELTPPEMCARYGSFSTQTGTDGSLFEKAPPQMGFYLTKKSYDWREVREYMKEGYLAVVVQYKGYWTRGGHYLVLEELSEDGLVRVRDSNLYNYVKLPRHKEDLFPWDTLNTAGMGYWIYPPKTVITPACTRCGDSQSTQMVHSYLCEKCETAQLRRNTYLTFSENG